MLRPYPRTRNVLFALLWAGVGLVCGMHYGYRAGEKSGFRQGVDATIAEVRRITESR